VNISSHSLAYERPLLNSNPLPPGGLATNGSAEESVSQRPVNPSDPNEKVEHEPTGLAETSEQEKSAQQHQQNAKAVQEAKQKAAEQSDHELIQKLASRDRVVRAHEQAHAAVGGQYAGGPHYQYQRGPDGVAYAVGGEVPIDVGRESSPEATIEKMQTVRRAALAPADPSPQDRQVAAEASQIEAQAREELASSNNKKAFADSSQKTEDGQKPVAGGDGSDGKSAVVTSEQQKTPDISPAPAKAQQASKIFSLYSNATGISSRGSLLDLSA